jgi:hypothetical protein
MSPNEIEKLYKLWSSSKISEKKFNLTSILLKFLDEMNIKFDNVTKITYY